MVSSVLSTAVPFLLQNRPGLKWVYDKAEHRIVQRVVDELPNPFDEEKETFIPVRYDDGVQVAHEAQLGPRLTAPRRPVNPNGYCRPHWWGAGPIRRILAFVFGGPVMNSKPPSSRLIDNASIRLTSAVAVILFVHSPGGRRGVMEDGYALPAPEYREIDQGAGDEAWCAPPGRGGYHGTRSKLDP